MQNGASIWNVNQGKYYIFEFQSQKASRACAEIQPTVTWMIAWSGKTSSYLAHDVNLHFFLEQTKGREEKKVFWNASIENHTKVRLLSDPGYYLRKQKCTLTNYALDFFYCSFVKWRSWGHFIRLISYGLDLQFCIASATYTRYWFLGQRSQTVQFQEWAVHVWIKTRRTWCGA